MLLVDGIPSSPYVRCPRHSLDVVSADNARDFILDKMDEAERDDDARQALLDTSYETIPDKSYAKTMWYVLRCLVLGASVGVESTDVRSSPGKLRIW